VPEPAVQLRVTVALPADAVRAPGGDSVERPAASKWLFRPEAVSALE
jgi:hypothetical protein